MFVCVILPSANVSIAVRVAVIGEGTGDTVAGRCHAVFAIVPPKIPGPVQMYVKALAGVSASVTSATSVTLSS